MSSESFRLTDNLRYDAPAALVVFLVALPLCLGVALASGVPLFSGIIAGAVGGIVIGLISRSPLSVSGPAAGLTVIVLGAVQSLPSFEVFLLAVFLGGVFQIFLGVIKAGIIGDFIPSSVIKGMLAAIGLILILKQVPHAVGYDRDPEGDFSFQQPDGENTFSALWSMLDRLTPGAVIIAVVSLVFLFWWDSSSFRKKRQWLQYLPGPLLVVVFGVAANAVFQIFFPALAISSEHLVSIPVSSSFDEFLGQFRFPDFNYIFNKEVWVTAITLCMVASIETLLSIEAIDKLDPYKRITPTNRELIAQGIGNMTAGLVGGMPVTSVIVRSSANVSSGARTRMSTILHGTLLIVSVIVIPDLLNKIPLAALAAVLISVGYKLTKPQIFIDKYEKGWAHLAPFVVTIVAILLTDLLVGIGVGLFVAGGFIIYSNFHSAILHVQEGDKHLIRFKKDMSFIHKFELKRIFEKIPNGSEVVIDVSRTGFIDYDNAEIINEYIESAHYKDIKVSVYRMEGQAAQIIKTNES
ncbi:MAG: SulP family inorganic anion transporter [Saprospiraceae bacterium]